MRMRLSFGFPTGGVAALLLSAPVLAQTQPDAGTLLRDMTPETLAPLAPSVDFDPQAEAPESGPEGGETVRLSAIRFEGNTVFDDERLRAVLGDDVLEESYDLKGLQSLANRISRHYREAGYPFARAVLPAQELSEGELRIEVVEGRYGEINAAGDEPYRASAEGYLSVLESGALIESAPLERATLLLGDLPGVSVSPVMRPGAEPGTGDLEVGVEEGDRFSGSVGVDNHGNRYSGEWRTQVGAQVNNLLGVGDELSFQALYSEENLWLGRLGYRRPLGHRGLEGSVSLARTEYDLGGIYADAGFTGTADVARVGLSYPLVRSQRSNLILEVGAVYKDMEDKLSGNTYEDKSSMALPLSLEFDHRDNVLGGGVTYGRFALAPGDLDSDAVDAPEGSHTRVNLDVARVQRLTESLTLFGQFRSQWADRELDSSETFTLGGARGVRAYPQGEGAGSRGWLAQMELRYRVGDFTPYLFHDAGRTAKFGDEDKRSIGGSGLGVRYAHGPWQAELAVAWKAWGGEPESDHRERAPRAWFAGGYRF